MPKTYVAEYGLVTMRTFLAITQPFRRSDDGFLLIEVMVSALLVAIIAIATFNGFDAVNRASADQRSHDQAVVLAAQSQEQLRTDPVTTLDALETTPHVYTQTVDGTPYTITQKVAPSNGSASGSGCNVTETTKQTGANVQITSAVTWPALSTAKRPEVSLTSIITPPAGSGLEIDVGNAPAPTAGVSGVSVVVTYKASGSTSLSTAEGTTNSNGCLVFGGIPSLAASIVIPQKVGYVTPGDLLKVPEKEVTLAPNITTHDAVTYAQGGGLKAEFYDESKAVTGDTFVAYNSSLTSEPKFELGSTEFGEYQSTGEHQYHALTGTYASTAETAKYEGSYPTGDLFPFPEPNKWLVYAGDCPENNPSKWGSVKGAEIAVTAGTITPVQIPISKVNLTVLEGTKAVKKSNSSEHLKITITNTACSSYTEPANNAYVVTTPTHKGETSGEGNDGLKNPYQPYGTYKLLAESSKEHKKYEVGSLETLTNSSEAGTSVTIYLGQKNLEAIRNTRTAAETAITTITAEEAALTSAKNAETTARTNRENTEKSNTETWKKEEECHNNVLLCIFSGFKSITPAERTAKENAQNATRTADQTAEAAEQAKRTSEETALHTRKTTEVNARETAKTEEPTATTEETESKVKVGTGP